MKYTNFKKVYNFNLSEITRIFLNLQKIYDKNNYFKTPGSINSLKNIWSKKKNLYKNRVLLQKVNKRARAKIFDVRFNIFLSFYFHNANRGLRQFEHAVLLQQLIFYSKKINEIAQILIKTIRGEGWLCVKGLFLIFSIDSLVIDDEPLWEPIEWSLVQTWIFFIFLFAWVAENLITSRYGSYTGRDKRVWFSWYKTFWLIEMWYALSFGAAAMFVIVPFYYELTYNVSFVFSWWNWYNRIFFFKFISAYAVVVLIAHVFQLNVRWANWKKNFFFIALILIFLFYLLYTQFIITFFSYFTDPLWYQKTRFIDYIQLSHEPLKWGWGSSKRDHFTYHKTSSVFWFKNDGPFAAAFLLINFFFFLTIFMLIVYWLVLGRKTCAIGEISFTLSAYCVSALKQFFFFFLLFYVLIFISFIVCYWRFPIEFAWTIDSQSWFLNFTKILLNYGDMLINLIFFK